MIDRKRAGKSIDENLVTEVLTFYSEIGEKLEKDELKHFAQTIIKENAIMRAASN
ncbi:unnamed protein product [Trifolium pratense]|uniref:Uncharacterized protein n=1 Tax=Trifolium pratense TaxID=57577 RepID=A0ACB0KC13_TRIPR|nr:unnamed protein product [Trifolium pratense]